MLLCFQVVVLAPTRELALQIQIESSKFGNWMELRSPCLFGGKSKKQQMKKLRSKQPEIIIATPGQPKFPVTTPDPTEAMVFVTCWIVSATA